jgi:hypothetical protein
MMRRYATVSGVFFGLLAIVQLARLLFRWPVHVASMSVPLWASALAVVIAGALATWAFRTSSTLRPD